jgi:hypothetical protein
VVRIQTAADYSLTVENLATQPSGTFGSVNITSGNTTGNKAGSSVTVAAVPATGYVFAGWTSNLRSAELVSKGNPYTFNIMDNTLLYAIFTVDGTNNPIEIHSTWELGHIGFGGSGTKPWGLGKSYKLMTNLQLDEWMPVGSGSSGNDDTRFTGVFNGNSHTLTINSIAKTVPPFTTPDNDKYHFSYVGIFGVVGISGVVENLSVEGTITSEFAQNIGDTQMVGAIAGCNYGNIENCFSNTNITTRGGDDSNNYVGGITGRTETGAVISGCHNTGALTADLAGFNWTKANHIGGISGENDGTVQYCSSTGAISAVKSLSGEAGGIAGRNRGTVRHSYTSGTVSAYNNLSSYSGGIAGSSYGIIHDSYSLCTVSTYGTLSGGGLNYSGGIAGEAGSPNIEGIIRNCYAIGDISAKDGSTERRSYDGGVTYISVVNNYPGGIVGWAWKVNIQNCVALNGTISLNAGTNIGRILGNGQYDSQLSNNRSIAISNLPDGTLGDYNGKTIDTNASKTLSTYQTDAGWAFGHSEGAPWVWDHVAQRPKLFWEH